MIYRERGADNKRMRSSRGELLVRMTRAIREYGFFEVFPGLFLGRSSQPTERLHSVFKPAFYVIAQGSKQVLLGDEAFGTTRVTT